MRQPAALLIDAQPALPPAAPPTTDAQTPAFRWDMLTFTHTHTKCVETNRTTTHLLIHITNPTYREPRPCITSQAALTQFLKSDTARSFVGFILALGDAVKVGHLQRIDDPTWQCSLNKTKHIHIHGSAVSNTHQYAHRVESSLIHASSPLQYRHWYRHCNSCQGMWTTSPPMSKHCVTATRHTGNGLTGMCTECC